MHLYLHIPFCRQACHYCDFHFSTNTSNKTEVVEAICAEIALRKNYLPSPNLETVYFGGGTPSMLSETELGLIFETIHKHFVVAPDAEITLEANPDDLTPARLRIFREKGVNRLSIGIQSFHDPHLTYLNRVHSAIEAEKSVREAQYAGIANISIDLIYAIPAPDHGILMQDIERTFALDIPHISAYCLTIEPRTTFGNWLKNHKIKPIDEEFAAAQFELLVAALAEMGYEQYEISNFARNGLYSRHNTSYWQQHPYLGVGPGAHSYDGTSREFNIPNNAHYVKAITASMIPAEKEILTMADHTNEYLLTGLRTKWGISQEKLNAISKGTFESQQKIRMQEMLRSGWMKEENGCWILTASGKLFADRIASDLFIE